MKKIILLCLIIHTSFTYHVAAQTPSNAQKVVEANQIATGNYKDVFNSFFQLAFDKISSDKKEINFTSNIYAVMLKFNPALLNDREYYRYRHLRNINFSLAGKLDSDSKFNGFNTGIKYALINRRDETVSRAFLTDVLYSNLGNELTILNTEMLLFVQTFNNDTTQRSRISAQVVNFRTGTAKFNELDIVLQNFIRTTVNQRNLVNIKNEIEADPEFSFSGSAASLYDKIKQLYNNKLLWTIALHDTTYNDQFMFSNVVLSSELVKGVIKPSAACNLEINLLSTLQLTDDTLIAGRDLSRTVFNFEPGLNLVLKGAQSDKSYLEFKLSGAYRHIFSKLYMNEKRDNLTMNGTLRIRVLNDIWVPLEIKYDPETGNVFGFLTVKANFTGLGNLLGR